MADDVFLRIAKLKNRALNQVLTKEKRGEAALQALRLAEKHGYEFVQEATLVHGANERATKLAWLEKENERLTKVNHRQQQQLRSREIAARVKEHCLGCTCPPRSRESTQPVPLERVLPTLPEAMDVEPPVKRLIRMPSKRRSQCRSCNRDIRVGDPIEYDPGARRARCERCVAGLPPGDSAREDQADAPVPVVTPPTVGEIVVWRLAEPTSCRACGVAIGRGDKMVVVADVRATGHRCVPCGPPRVEA